MKCLCTKIYNNGIEKALDIIERHLVECKQTGDYQGGYALLAVYGELCDTLADNDTELHY